MVRVPSFERVKVVVGLNDNGKIYFKRKAFNFQDITGRILHIR